MAALTATGGGVLRDLLVKEIPAVLCSGFYATAALIGGAVYVTLGWLQQSLEVKMIATILVTVILRFFAMHTNLSLPRIKSLPDSPSRLTGRRKQAK